MSDGKPNAEIINNKSANKELNQLIRLIVNQSINQLIKFNC